MTFGRHPIIRLLAAAALTAPLLNPRPASADDPVDLDAAGHEAAEHECAPFELTLHFDNDGTFAKPNHDTDRHYTNGAKLTFAWKPAFADDMADALDSIYSLGPRDQRHTAFGLAFGQNIYTPDPISVAAPQPDERPYAGWLYGGAYLQRSVDNTMDHLELDLGVVGPSSVAEQTQKEVHRWRNLALPQGWSHQLPDEGEFNIIYQRSWKFALIEPGDCKCLGSAFSAEGIPQAGVTLGTAIDELDLGGIVRAGWHLPQDFGPARIVMPADATHLDTTTRDLSFYAFFRATGRIVAHNVFIQGDNFRDSPGVTIKPLVGEIQFGAAIAWRQIEFTYSQTITTEEFNGQHGTDSFGAFTLAWRGYF